LNSQTLKRKFLFTTRQNAAPKGLEQFMAITIEIPTAFRRFTEGSPKVDSGATTVAEALNDLTAKFPALSRHVRDEQGQIRQFLNVYLNEEDIRFLNGESSPLKDGDRVLLVPSIAGG
jgi:sulfur-carrier protein